MKEVKQWLEGKQHNIAANAIVVAMSASTVSEALTEMRNQIDTNISQPPLDQWLSFYKRHRSVLELLRQLFSFEGIDKLLESSNNDKDLDLTAQQQDLLRNLYLQPKTLFFFKVWAPCSIHYKTSPTVLFRQARQGKVSAFEKLLRLDNSVIFDSKLAAVFHQLKGKPNKRSYQKLLFAFSRPATERTDPKRMKIIVAGLISYMSESMGKRLTEPQIRGLFDAIARDNDLGLQDEDIPKTPDTFAQAIRREAKKFKALAEPDKR